MDLEITEERRAYLEARGFTILSACPGSGKTTCIVKKLSLLKGYCEKEYGMHTGCACLSFTNKASDELYAKYRELNNEEFKFPNVFSTIDSFITQNVVMPFWYLCEKCKSKPVIVNDLEVLDEQFFYKYASGGTIKTAVIPKFQKFYRLIHKCPPSKIVKEINGFSLRNRKIDKIKEDTLYRYCTDVFNHRLENGYITSQDAIWIAGYILHSNNIVARALVNRFPYIIVDEAQDNSEIQFALFNTLINCGLKNLEYVGDPCQSIYEFRNAKPTILLDLMSDAKWKTLHFSECRRSNQRIIDLYSKLKPSNLPEIYAHNVEDKGVPIIIYRYNEALENDVISHFIKTCNENSLSSRAILTRSNMKCLELAGSKNSEFHYWKSFIPYTIIQATQDFNVGDYEAAFLTIRHLLSKILFTVFQYKEKNDFLVTIQKDVSYNAKILGFLLKVPSFSQSFEEWTKNSQIMLKDYWRLDHLPDFEVHSRQKGYKMKDMASIPVKDYYPSNVSRNNSVDIINTIHSVKGASIDAVLLFLSENSKGQNISLKDFPLQCPAIMNEKQRLIYVACSRAQQFLALAVPSTVTDEDVKNVMKGIDYGTLKLSL